MNKTKIDWANYTWNPISGCSPASEGCQNCYAERVSKRFKLPWGKPTIHWERLYHSKFPATPSRIFVCSMSDLFHEDVNPEWIWQIWAAFRQRPGHTFIVLTKRAERMRSILSELLTPLPNVWLGVTAENQARADERIPLLLRTPAAKRFVSVEPMLGEISLRKYAYSRFCRTVRRELTGIDQPSLDWVICGGESGDGARPMHPDWARSLRDQCKSAGVPFFFKQWGEFAPCEWDGLGICPECGEEHGRVIPGQLDSAPMIRVGKKAAGHLLDGVEHREFPE